MFLLFFYAQKVCSVHFKTSLSLGENARTFQLKRKYVLVKT